MTTEAEMRLAQAVREALAFDIHRVERRDGVDFNVSADAYHNLGGAIIDYERWDGHDPVILATMKRVETQLAQVRKIIFDVIGRTM